MKATLTVLLLILLLAFALPAQSEKEPPIGWTQEAIGALNFSQNQFDNWNQGGEDSWAWQMDFNVTVKYNQSRYSLTNTGKFSYGKTKVGDQTARKAADELRLESLFAYKHSERFNSYVGVKALTQIAKGYVYMDDQRQAVSQFLDPGYFTESLGLAYLPMENLSIRAGAALKETVTQNFPAPYADDPATPEIEKTKTEAGVESVVDFKRNLAENLVYTTKLDLFSNLEALNQTDVIWDHVLSAKVSKYIATSFHLQLFYDRDISKKRQLKQTLAVGLSFLLF